jgi:hypothetical protein
MPRHRAGITCVTCGRICPQGFAAINHARVCASVGSYDDAGTHDVDFLDAEGEEDDAGGVGNAVVPRDHSVEAYLAKLEANGTLDTSQVLGYLGWGHLTLTRKDREVCRFLRSVEQGGGASLNSVRASLDYARSLGGRGSVLPVTVRTCWSKVEKVCSFASIFGNGHCE